MIVKDFSIAVLIFNTVLFFGQHKNKEELDYILFVESKKLDEKSDYKGSIMLNKKVLVEAKKINYKNGIAWAYYKIADSYSNYGEYKESLENLKFAEAYSIKLNDRALKAAVATGYGKNYNEQKLSISLAVRKFLEAESIARTINNSEEKRYWLNYIYQNLISSYTNLQKWDSAYVYMHKSYRLYKTPYNAEALTCYHLNISKKQDSIKYYLDSSKGLLDQYPQLIFEKSIYHNLLGDFNFEAEKYHEAIKNYKLAMSLAEKSAASTELLKAVRAIAECYEILDDSKNAMFFQKRHNNLRDSLNNRLFTSWDYSVQNIINDVNEKAKNKNQKLIRTLSTIILITMLISLCFFIKSKYNNSCRRIQHLSNKRLILDKEKKLNKKEKQIKVLQSQINENFENLISLAKSNNPNFYVRFQETYQTFQPSLLSINKSLSVSDLTFCSYLYLDFQTKEIAEYTFKTVKTVQNRKNSLRKKLTIPSSEDLYVWMKRMV